MIEEYKKNKITAVGVVYNEINRIENTLKCFLWCDDILVVDRNSNDGTRDIISKYTKNIVTIYNQEFNPIVDNTAWYNNVKTEWIIGFTASDIIHPILTLEIKKLIDQDNGEYDIIEIPFNRYILGINSKFSPWYTKTSKISVFRKSVYEINPNSVHSSNILNTNRIYTIKLKDTSYSFSHLTHPNMNQMMDRHLNYIRSESKMFNEKTLSKPLKDVLKALYHTIIRRKTIFNGYDGLALAFSYISYYMLLYVYKWDKHRGGSNLNYKKISEDILREWDKHNAK
jgi:hypothetical protein